MPHRRVPLFCLLLACAGCRPATRPVAPAPRQLHVAGSSAVYPFSTAVAERFTRADPNAIAPLAQADGSGAGIARFCAKPTPGRPDIVGTTRALTAGEQALCDRNGIGAITTIRFGWTALVLAGRPAASPLFLTRGDVRRALAGPAATWRAVAPALPDLPLHIDGPAPRADVADGLFDIILAAGCVEGRCVRRDGRYRGHGASAPLALTAALATRGALAIVPWSDAVQRGIGLRLAGIDGVLPTTDTIASGRYPWRLPLMLIVRTADVRSVRGVRTLLALYADGWATGEFQRRGLVPLAPSEQAIATRQVAALVQR